MAIKIEAAKRIKAHLSEAELEKLYEKAEANLKVLTKKFPDGQVKKWPSKEDAVKIVNQMGYVDQFTGKAVKMNTCWYDADVHKDPKGDYLYIGTSGLLEQTDMCMICIDYENGEVSST